VGKESSSKKKKTNKKKIKKETIDELKKEKEQRLTRGDEHALKAASYLDEKRCFVVESMIPRRIIRGERLI